VALSVMPLIGPHKIAQASSFKLVCALLCPCYEDKSAKKGKGSHDAKGAQALAAMVVGAPLFDMAPLVSAVLAYAVYACGEDAEMWGVFLDVVHSEIKIMMSTTQKGSGSGHPHRRLYEEIYSAAIQHLAATAPATTLLQAMPDDAEAAPALLLLAKEGNKNKPSLTPSF